MKAKVRVFAYIVAAAVTINASAISVYADDASSAIENAVSEAITNGIESVTKDDGTALTDEEKAYLHEQNYNAAKEAAETDYNEFVNSDEYKAADEAYQMEQKAIAEKAAEKEKAEAENKAKLEAENYASVEEYEAALAQYEADKAAFEAAEQQKVDLVAKLNEGIKEANDLAKAAAEVINAKLQAAADAINAKLSAKAEKDAISKAEKEFYESQEYKDYLEEKAAYESLLADYNKAIDDYNTKMAEYEAEKAAYDNDKTAYDEAVEKYNAYQEEKEKFEADQAKFDDISKNPPAAKSTNGGMDQEYAHIIHNPTVHGINPTGVKNAWLVLEYPADANGSKGYDTLELDIKNNKFEEKTGKESGYKVTVLKVLMEDGSIRYYALTYTGNSGSNGDSGNFDLGELLASTPKDPGNPPPAPGTAPTAPTLPDKVEDFTATAPAEIKFNSEGIEWSYKAVEPKQITAKEIPLQSYTMATYREFNYLVFAPDVEIPAAVLAKPVWVWDGFNWNWTLPNPPANEEGNTDGDVTTDGPDDTTIPDTDAPTPPPAPPADTEPGTVFAPVETTPAGPAAAPATTDTTPAEEPATVDITEPDTPLADAPEIVIREEDIPLNETPVELEIPEDDVPLGEMTDDLDIEDDEVPLGDMPATGDAAAAASLGFLSSLTLLGAAFFGKKVKKN